MPLNKILLITLMIISIGLCAGGIASLVQLNAQKAKASLEKPIQSTSELPYNKYNLFTTKEGLDCLTIIDDYSNKGIGLSCNWGKFNADNSNVEVSK